MKILVYSLRDEGREFGVHFYSDYETIWGVEISLYFVNIIVYQERAWVKNALRITEELRSGKFDKK